MKVGYINVLIDIVIMLPLLFFAFNVLPLAETVVVYLAAITLQVHQE